MGIPTNASPVAVEKSPRPRQAPSRARVSFQRQKATCTRKAGHLWNQLCPADLREIVFNIRVQLCYWTQRKPASIPIVQLLR
jgi:hypothetical protein